jgi:hypothetical protein
VEHGHALLIKAIKQARPEWLSRRDIRMLEVGTTREPLPHQDSTRVLAQFCKDHGWSFVTCDMDPINSERARSLFAELGVDFEAVTAKGEDYIASQTREFDVVYLDAYDFDHGKHSEVRQQRYEEFLGSRIDQEACEIMHLEAMQGLMKAGRDDCLVVLDDTWREKKAGPWPGKGPWLGKGPKAVPWALDHGWDLVLEPPGYRAVALDLPGGHLTVASKAQRQYKKTSTTAKAETTRVYKGLRRRVKKLVKR